MARQYNLIIDQGATFSTNVIATSNATANAFDLSGFPIGRAQIRPSHSSATVISEFVVDPHTSNTNGIVTLSLNQVATANIPPGTYVYDVLVAGHYIPSQASIFGVGGYGVLSDSPTITANTFQPGSNTLYQNAYNYVPWETATFAAPNNAFGVSPYTTTNGTFANVAYSNLRDFYISSANDVLFEISSEDISHTTSGTHYLSIRPLVNTYNTYPYGDDVASVTVVANTTGFRELIFANVYPYGANSAHVGNSHLVVSGSQHPNAIFNNAYSLPHTSNSHPLHAMHFQHWGIAIEPNKRWIYSMSMKSDRSSYGGGSPIRLQCYTANATHNPNTTSYFTHLASNDAPFDTGATGPHESGNLYSTSAPGVWSTVSTVVDLRTSANANTHEDWHKDTIRGNTHVQNGLNVGFGLSGRLHFRDQVDQVAYGSNALAGGYPDYSIMHDSSSPTNEIQYWRVGDEVAIDYVGGWKHLANGGRSYSRTWRTITEINEGAPWITVTIPGGPYGGAIYIPSGLAGNSTYDNEYFAQTVNLSQQTRNNERFRGANTHNSIILSFSPWFTGYGDDLIYINNIMLEEQANVEIRTPSEMTTVESSAAEQVQFTAPPAVIRIAEGSITVTPSVTR